MFDNHILRIQSYLIKLAIKFALRNQTFFIVKERKIRFKLTAFNNTDDKSLSKYRLRINRSNARYKMRECAL